MSCCKKIFNFCDPVPACIKQLIIKTPFNNTSLTFKILDKFNKIYKATHTTDSSGFFTIQVQDDGLLVADIPDALFNEYAGVFKLMMDGKQWTINGEQVDYIAIIFKNITPIVDTFTINPLTADGKITDFSPDFNSDFGSNL